MSLQHGDPPVKGAVLGRCQVSPFIFDSVDTLMDTNMGKYSVYAVFSGLSLGSTPTVSIKRGSVENTAFPLFLLILCGFQGL